MNGQDNAAFSTSLCQSKHGDSLLIYHFVNYGSIGSFPTFLNAKYYFPWVVVLRLALTVRKSSDYEHRVQIGLTLQTRDSRQSFVLANRVNWSEVAQSGPLAVPLTSRQY